MKIQSLSKPDAITLADIFAERGNKVTLEKTAEGLLGTYYAVTIDGPDHESMKEQMLKDDGNNLEVQK